MDQLTVLEHLAFYARIRGISDVSHNVQAVIHAVGLSSFASFQAMALSGGNKRKLSLGIALMGNPSVVLLDEPSSGMDAAAKRVMWKTLSGVVAGRAILLTTHSMEEAAALASRAGIMARRMLAMGTTEYLRKKHGDALHVHLVTKNAPHTSEEEMARLKQWVVDQFPGSEVEEKTYHGQLRFSVPAGDLSPTPASAAQEHSDANGDVIDGGRGPVGMAGVRSGNGGIGALIMLLEEKKEELGLEYYSVSPTTLDQVFLSIVGKHNVEEENYKVEEKARWWEWPKKTRN
jgi:ATP-binding cassette subfamily A (ABC1) protein 3